MTKQNELCYFNTHNSYNDVKCGKIHVTLNYNWLDIFPEPIPFRVTCWFRIWERSIAGRDRWLSYLLEIFDIWYLLSNIFTVPNNSIDYKEKSDEEKNVDNLGTMGSLDDDGSEGWYEVKWHIICMWQMSSGWKTRWEKQIEVQYSLHLVLRWWVIKMFAGVYLYWAGMWHPQFRKHCQ